MFSNISESKVVHGFKSSKKLVNQIIIDIVTDEEKDIYKLYYEKERIELVNKIQKKYPESKNYIIIYNPNLGFSSQQIDILKSVNHHKTKLQIIGHCTKGCDYLESTSHFVRVNYAKLASVLATIIGPRKKDNPLTISLNACFAAERNFCKKSFAEQFHEALKYFGVYSIVKARTTMVTGAFSNNYTKKTVLQIPDAEKLVLKIEAYRSNLHRLKVKLEKSIIFKMIKNAEEKVVKLIMKIEELKKIEHQLQLKNNLFVSSTPIFQLNDLTANISESKSNLAPIYPYFQEDLLQVRKLIHGEQQILEDLQYSIVFAQKKIKDFLPEEDHSRLTLSQLEEMINENNKLQSNLMEQLEKLTVHHQINSKLIYFFDNKDQQRKVCLDYNDKLSTLNYLKKHGCFKSVEKSLESKDTHKNSKSMLINYNR